MSPTQVSKSRFEQEVLDWIEIRARFGVPYDMSFIEFLAALPEKDQLDVFSSLTPKMAARLSWTWLAWARDKQIPPTDPWDVWLVNAGRGWGKTKTGAQTVIEWAREWPGTIIHLVGRTAADVRDTMIVGPSGIVTLSPPDFRATYSPSTTRVTFPNGSYCLSFTSAIPDDLRGPECHKMWCDEPAVWLKQKETWDMAILGCRKARFAGDRPQVVVTTTPKSNELIIYLLDLAEDFAEREGHLSPEVVAYRKRKRNGAPLADPVLLVRMTKGSTIENKTNLAPTFLTGIIEKYKGTRLWAQEIEAELLSDNPAALWKRARIDALRVNTVPAMRKIYVGVDPSGSSGDNANECGIVVVGEGDDGDLYVLADASRVDTPAGWASTVMELATKAQADTIVAERNFGGQMVEEVLRGAARKAGVSLPQIKMVTASRGKYVRAEPVALLYEQEPGHVHHVGYFLELEDEMCTWTPKDSKSPNRLDALVWAVHGLAGFTQREFAVYFPDGTVWRSNG